MVVSNSFGFRSLVWLYIQSAYTLHDDAKMQQEQSSLLNVNDGFKKMIIVGNQHLSHFNENGILIMSIFDFLAHDRADTYKNDDLT